MKTTTEQQVLSSFMIIECDDRTGFFWKDMDSRTSIVFATYKEAYDSAKQDFLRIVNFYDDQV